MEQKNTRWEEKNLKVCHLLQAPSARKPLLESLGDFQVDDKEILQLMFHLHLLALSFQGEVEDAKWVLDITRTLSFAKPGWFGCELTSGKEKKGRNFPREASAVSAHLRIPRLQWRYPILALNSHRNRWRMLWSVLTILFFLSKTILISTLFYLSTSSWSLN